ncbi:hypothetical protein P7C70_g456, partial [Phenoliferia sp. Uapishka_3]
METDREESSEQLGWDDLVAKARTILTAAHSIKERNAFLTSELLTLAAKPDLEPAKIQDLVRLLLLTVSRYTEQASRAAVLAVLSALLAHEQQAAPDAATSGASSRKGIAGGLIKWVESEVDRLDKAGTVAPGTRIGVLGWATTIYDSTLGLEDLQWTSLINSISRLVDSILDESANLKESARQGVKISVRRVVRNKPRQILRLVETLSSAKAEPPFLHATFLGLVMDVSLRLRDLKGQKDTAKTTVASTKSIVDTYYVNNVVSAKVTPPPRSINAFHDYFAATATLEDVTNTFVPAFEKALAKQPEVALVAAATFFTSIDRSTVTTSALLLKLLPAVLAQAKSLSASVRLASVHLFAILFGKSDPTDVVPAAELAYAPLKGGKTSSPDHRTTLFSMLALLSPSVPLSPSLVSLVLSLLPKESNDVAIASMMRVLSTHLPAALDAGATIPALQVAALVKGMQEPKPTIRRSVHLTVGSVIWSLPGNGANEAAQAFGVGLLPGFESALKTVTTNPLNAPAGSLEGYVAIAVLKGRMGQWGDKKIDDFIAANATMQTVLITGAKPSFLLWDKVYRKAGTTDDEAWFGHALEAVARVDEDKLQKDQTIRAAYSQALVHLAVESIHFETRKATNAFIKTLNHRNPPLAHLIVREGVKNWLFTAEKTKVAAKPLSEDQEAPQDRSPRLRPVLIALTSFDAETPTDVREGLLCQLLVLAHHPKLVGSQTGIWIDLLQYAASDPNALIQAHLPALLSLIWANASTNPSSELFAQGAYRAATTLAFVSPSVAVPDLFSQLQDDLSVHHLSFIGPTEYGIWSTPEGTPFVDVLSAQKPKVPTSHKNSKEREIEIWEAELREALARKKPVVASLSKPDRILLERQLAKEAAIRQDMATALGRLRRGFALLLCLVHSGAEIVREYLATMVKDVLAVIVLRPATLVAAEAFATYQTLGDICSERLGNSKDALGAAVLRSVEAEVVPVDYSSEPLAALVTRVMYRLRILADQAPFDAGTYAYTAPLISRILRNGGVGLAKSDAEAVQEQLTLALDFIAFHARECSDTAFPRLTMIGDLIATLLAYPTLSRTATGALADMAEAMKHTSTPAEIDALLQGAMTEEAYVRFACLQALSPLDLTELEFPVNLWIAAHDVDERNSQLALKAWEENGLDVPEDFLTILVPSLCALSPFPSNEFSVLTMFYAAHSSNAIRRATANAVAEGIDLHPSEVAEAIRQIIVEYHDKNKLLLPRYDQFGMVIEESLTAEDPWKTRVALATTLKLVAAHFAVADVAAFFDLLIVGEALGDRSQAVRSEMLEAAIVVIDLHGKENLQTLIATFETFLERPSGDQVQDYITEALVILFGRLARHLEPTDPRVAAVIGRLVDALRTPSEVVQVAVCDCLPALIRVIGDDVPPLVDQLLSDLFQAPKYAERRGAAYGLAGVVRGRGLSSLKEFGVLGRLQDNAEDKKSMEARQGAIFGYEILANILGRLFEPYVSEILPLLLASFGDASTSVRQATSDAAKAIMSKLSGYAVKVILPTLLAGLDDKQWRAKKGAIELMGAMAFLAPKQLSASLPTIIPRLTEVLTDSHKQVREAANTSLKRFGEVVTNPEIQAMTAVLLEALVDPSRKTPKALDALLSTTFAHFIDSSSLALIIPILDRGLRERSADVKRKASAIVGNMATLTAPEDLIPYLTQLVPLLRGVLIDPVPEARSTAAKSLGGLVERLGEQNFPDLIETLMAVLKSPSSGVDQQGAAQGVSEILAGLGVERLEGILPSILASTSSPRSYVREGHISLLIFLPATFGDRFSPYLGRIIQPVLSGLADDSDYVREASMRAGRMIVANHSAKAIDLLLPELELGLFDVSWRIRQSSVQLVGDLLFRITGVSGKPDEDDDGEEDQEDTGLSTDSSKKALIDTLGRERRDRVLAGLYIVRQDSVGGVRQAALHVWKALVQNTPRTVREMLPVLMQIIVRTLASPGIEQRETAARCLADTCRKLGEAVLGEVIGILQKAMTSPDRRQREGVCLALTEIMRNSTESSLEAHESSVIVIVRSALVDSDPTVRSAAAQAFDVAQQVIGTRSIDETIPTLLDALQQPGETADAALEALKEVMSVRADKIFPILIPRLIASPITAFNARALASLVRVAGAALGRRLTHIVDALQTAVETEEDEETSQEIDSALTAVLGSVEDHESGLGSIQMHLLGLAKSESPAKRIIGCSLFARFCQATEADFSDYTVDWIRQLVSMFDDRVPDVVGESWKALDALVKTIDKEDMEVLVVPLRRTIEGTGTPGLPTDGFSRPNGLKPILPILLQGLLAGTAEQREQAAFALGDLVERTSPEAFKAYCIQTVGPLNHPAAAPVKSAILSTLTIFLTRVPQFVKPFFPQLQRSFVKSLSDTSSNSVRNRGAAALGVLMVHQPRVAPLITELTNLASTEEGEVRDSVVSGLANVVLSGGQNLPEESKSSLLDLVGEAFSESNNKEPYNSAIGRLVAAVAVHEASLIESIVSNYLVSDHLPATALSSITLKCIIDQAPQALYDLDVVEACVAAVLKNASPASPPSVARPGREAKELLREREPFASDEGVQSKL